jgi:putative cardiolipin synthase
LNLDPRAVKYNTEIGVVLTSPEMATALARSFDENIETFAFRLELHRQEGGYERILWHGIENGRQQVYKADPHTGFWRRFGLGFIGLFPIESQL